MMEYYHFDNTPKRDYDSLTKKEIQKILKEEHKTDVSLRPRKSTMIALLKELEDDTVMIEEPSTRYVLILFGVVMLIAISAILIVA